MVSTSTDSSTTQKFWLGILANIVQRGGFFSDPCCEYFHDLLSQKYWNKEFGAYRSVWWMESLKRHLNWNLRLLAGSLALQMDTVSPILKRGLASGIWTYFLLLEKQWRAPFRRFHRNVSLSLCFCSWLLLIRDEMNKTLHGLKLRSLHLRTHIPRQSKVR